MIKNIAVTISLLFLIGCSGSENFEDLKNAGIKSYLRGNTAEAKELLSKAFKIDYKNRDALYYLGLCYQQEYLLDSAMFYFKRIDLLYPNDREVNMSIYHVSIELQDWAHTIEAIKILIRTGDPAEKYHKQLSELSLKLDRRYAAMLYAKLHKEAYPEEPASYVNLGNLASDIDSVEFALSIMNEAIAKFGEQTEFIMNRAIFISRLGRHSEAEKIMRAQYAGNPDSYMVIYNLANVLTSQDDKEKLNEGYNLYLKVREVAGNVFNIDSTITAVKIQIDSL